MTKRNIEIKVRLSRKEAENLNKQVKKCRLSREAYLRHLITGEVPREAPPPEYFAFMREMHYVGHNLMKYPSVVMLEQLRTLDKRRIGYYIGKLPEEKMQDVTRALCVSLAIRQNTAKGM